MQALKEFIVKNNVTGIAIILFLTWLTAFIVSKIMSKKVFTITAKLTKNEKEEFNASQYTKLKMAKRLVLLMVWVVGISIALLKIESLKAIGTAVLASAGFIGLIAGLAARASLSNLIAGITIAFAQPIRLRDYVTIDNEFGQVDELTLLYTIIKTWDNRRLVVPNSVIVSAPIRNFSLGTQDILAEAIIPVPHGTDIEKAKQLIIKIAKESPHYNNKQEPEVRIAEIGQEFITLRTLALANDAKSAYVLSTEIKEKIIKEFPKESIELGK